MKTNNKIDFEQRLKLGKKHLPKNMWELWENFVTISYEQSYEVKNVDEVLRYLMMLNSDLTIKSISKEFCEENKDENNTHIMEILNTIAKLHERGIDLLEYATKSMKITVSPDYIENLKRIKELTDMGENIENATTIAQFKLARMTIDDNIYQILIGSEHNILGLAENDSLIIGEYYDETHIIYIIEKDKYTSYFTHENNTLTKYNDSSKTTIEENKINIKIYRASIKYILEEYTKVFDIYFKQDIDTLIDALREIRSISKKNDIESIKNIIKELITNTKQDVKSLKKSAE